MPCGSARSGPNRKLLLWWIDRSDPSTSERNASNGSCRSRLSSRHRNPAKHGSDRDDVACGFESAAAAGRAIGIERFDLVADPDRLSKVVGTAGDANAHLIGFVGMGRDLRAMQGIDADQIEAQFVCHNTREL